MFTWEGRGGDYYKYDDDDDYDYYEYGYECNCSPERVGVVETRSRETIVEAVNDDYQTDDDIW